MSRQTTTDSRASSEDGMDYDIEKHESTSSDSLLNDEAIKTATERQRRRQSLTQLLRGCVLVLCCVLSFMAGYHIDATDLKSRCFDMDTASSPVKAAIKPYYKLVRFNGTLNLASSFRGQSDTVDAAWHRLAGINWFSMSFDDVVKAGGRTDAIRLPDDKGGGYMGTLDMSHQLHCLNFIRKSMYHNIDYYRNRSAEFTDPEHTVTVHLDHCIEIIRQNILCHADPGVLTYHWLKDYPRPYANFNTWKVCRDPEAVAQWGAARETKNQSADWSNLIRPGSAFFDHPPAPEDYTTPPPWGY